MLTGMSVAGATVLWRNWLEDHKGLKSWIMNSLGGFHKALTCGSCFTYWLALIATLAIRPLETWQPLSFAMSFTWLANVAVHWMTLAWLAVFLRFAYVALQELVNYQVHTLRNHDH